MDDLLPCPFCNCLHAPGILTVNIGHSGGYHHVVCNTNYAGCGAQGAVASTKELAAVAWNRRAANAPADPALLALDRELRIRNLIAEREFNTAAANRELTQFGEWRWDHDAADKACADAIAALLAPDGAVSEGVAG